MKKIPAKITYLAWLVAIVSTLGSLYFSQILHLAPCILCWFQRIFMYPLVFIIPVGILIKDKKLPYYVLSLSSIGTIIAFYHILLYYGVIPEALAPCVNGVSCTTRLLDYFGFISIPLLSFMSFLAITIGMFISLKIKEK